MQIKVCLLLVRLQSLNQIPSTLGTFTFKITRVKSSSHLAGDINLDEPSTARPPANVSRRELRRFQWRVPHPVLVGTPLVVLIAREPKPQSGYPGVLYWPTADVHPSAALIVSGGRRQLKHTREMARVSYRFASQFQPWMPHRTASTPHHATRASRG